MKLEKKKYWIATKERRTPLVAKYYSCLLYLDPSWIIKQDSLPKKYIYVGWNRL